MERVSMQVMSSVFRGAFAASIVLILAACTTGGPTSILGIGAKNNDAPPPPSDTITEAELRAYCPNVELREGTAISTKYEKGGAPTETTEADPSKVIHQASLSEVSRSCSYEGDGLTMNVAVTGKLVPGPKAVAGSVSLPIRVAVTSNDAVLYSQLTQFPLNIDPLTGAATFVFNDPNVVLPKPTERSYRVFIGFDEGAPAAKKKKKSDS
jgi:hypothetical protein